MSELHNSHADVVVHLWNHCHHCLAEPIVGRRYECQNCPAGPDNDLCENCYEKWLKGELEHPAKDSYAAGLHIAQHRFEGFTGKALSGFLGWLEVPHVVAAEPVVPDRAVLRPIFNAGMDTTIGSYAFAMSIEGQPRPLIVTALHVLDELSKNLGINCSLKHEEHDLKTRQYTGKELPTRITEVNLFDVYAGNWMMALVGNAGPMLVLPEAATGVEEPYSDRDIAAFWVHAGDVQHVNPLPLALSAPQKGEPVWLAARSTTRQNQRTFKAVVVECTARSLIFKYEKGLEKPSHTSGAPILNSKGEVVAINVGAGHLHDNYLGHGNHAENIRRHLLPAL